MQILHQIIRSMSKEEVRAFKIFIDRIQTTEDRKVVSLFDLIRKHKGAITNAEILKLLPDAGNLNALYQLRNRLRKYIDQSQHSFFFSKSPESEALQLYLLGKTWFDRQVYNLAYDYYERASKIAQDNQLLDALELIYTGLINASLHLPSINPEVYIKLRKENLIQLNSIKSLDELLTGLNYKLAISQQTGTKDDSVTRLLEQTLDDFLNNPQLSTSIVLKVRLTEGVARLLLQRHEYLELAEYLNNSLPALIETSCFNQYNHDVLLKLLTWKTNAYFKAELLERSLQSAEELKSAMEEFGGILFDKYFVFYNSALIYANSVLDLPKAISILRKTIQNPLLEKHPIYSLIVRLNLALCLFENEELKPAMKQIAQLQLHPAYQQADEDLKLKIEVSELIMRADADEWDIVAIRTKQIQRDFQKSLEEREAMSGLLKILRTIASKDGLLNSKQKSENKAWLEEHYGSVPESQVIDLYEWFKRKYEHL